MQVSLSTKSIHGVTRIGADPESVLDKSVYGITVDAETLNEIGRASCRERV